MLLLSVLFRNPAVFLRAFFLDFRFGHPIWANGQYMRKNLALAQDAAVNLVRVDDVHQKGVLTGWYAAACNIARLELYRRSRAA